MSPSYVSVEWIHNFEDEPQFIHAELDEEMFEIRKIEVFKDGRAVKVSRNNPEIGSTRIGGEEPWPSVNDINTMPVGEFHAKKIDRATFEDIWASTAPCH